MARGCRDPAARNAANASTSPGTPARIIITPMPRVSSDRNGGRSCQPRDRHGTSPASVHGATTKKTPSPGPAMVVAPRFPTLAASSFQPPRSVSTKPQSSTSGIRVARRAAATPAPRIARVRGLWTMAKRVARRTAPAQQVCARKALRTRAHESNSCALSSRPLCRAGIRATNARARRRRLLAASRVTPSARRFPKSSDLRESRSSQPLRDATGESDSSH